MIFDGMLESDWLASHEACQPTTRPLDYMPDGEVAEGRLTA
jgi:hypothetical protein